MAAAAGPVTQVVLEIHRVICNALDLAVDRQLIDANPARRARPPKRTNRSTVPAIWNAQQLGRFLAAASRLRLYPALHLAAHSGMRRGEVAGLNWGDLDIGASSLSIVRSRQATMGRTVEGPVKTRTSRRRIDLDPNAVELLQQWRHRLVTEGATLEPSTPMFLNTRHRTPSPESFSQLFGQIIATTDLPRIRFHDSRHTHVFRCSSPPVSRSKSCPSGSDTPTPASRCTPTSTCCPAWAPQPPASSPPSSTRAGRRLPSHRQRNPRSTNR